MLRHLQNLNELVIYASISCGAAFIGRLFPALYFPILLLRIGVLAYCLYVISGEDDKELAVVVCGALILGMIGGNWDWLELYLKFNQELIGRYLSIVFALALMIIGVVSYAKASKK